MIVTKKSQQRVACNRCPSVSPGLAATTDQLRKLASANGWNRRRANMTRENDQSGPWLDLCPKCGAVG